MQLQYELDLMIAMLWFKITIYLFIVKTVFSYAVMKTYKHIFGDLNPFKMTNCS